MPTGHNPLDSQHTLLDQGLEKFFFVTTGDGGINILWFYGPAFIHHSDSLEKILNSRQNQKITRIQSITPNHLIIFDEIDQPLKSEQIILCSQWGMTLHTIQLIAFL